MKQQSLRIIILLLFSILMLVPIQLVRAEHWVEVVRFEGHRDIFTTAPFVCNYSVWRIRYESYSGDRFPMIIPGVYTLNITIYRQGETTDYIDRISEEPTQGMYYYHLIRNNTGSFYMNISTGYSDSYSIIVEQNTDSVFVTPTPIPSPTPINSNTENNSASPLGMSLEIIAALVVMFVAAFAAVLLVLRRKSFRRNLMPKKLSATTITIMLTITMLASMSMVSANFIPTRPEIQINSPTQSYIKFYQTNSVFLSFEVRIPPDAPRHFPEVNNISYSLDGQSAIVVNEVEKSENVHWFSGICTMYSASVMLDDLAVGDHTVTVFCQDSIGRDLSKTVDFTVDTPLDSNTLTQSTPTPYGKVLGYPSDRIIAAIEIVIFLLIIASISLVYFKGRKVKS